MRRQPHQLRARQTVEAILDAVLVLLRRDGITAVTTNRIAAAAGVSIGSVYQYFPDKAAIYTALHARHSEQMTRLIERTLVDHAESSLEQLVTVLLTALIDAHADDPRLHEALADVPGGETKPFAQRLRNAFRLALASHQHYTTDQLDRILFVVPVMVDALAHGITHRPARLSLAAARRESVRAVLAYLAAA